MAKDVVQTTDFSVSDFTNKLVDNTWDCNGTPLQLSFSIVSFNASAAETLIVAGILREAEP